MNLLAVYLFQILHYMWYGMTTSKAGQARERKEEMVGPSGGNLVRPTLEVAALIFTNLAKVIKPRKA